MVYDNFRTQDPCTFGSTNYTVSWRYDDLSSDVVFKLTSISQYRDFWTGIYFGEKSPVGKFCKIHLSSMHYHVKLPKWTSLFNLPFIRYFIDFHSNYRLDLDLIEKERGCARNFSLKLARFKSLCISISRNFHGGKTSFGMIFSPFFPKFDLLFKAFPPFIIELA